MREGAVEYFVGFPGGFFEKGGIKYILKLWSQTLVGKMSNRKTLKLYKGTKKEKIIEYPRTFPRPYTIKAYSRQRARELGVRIKVSTKPDKKLDVFSKKGEKLASIGAAGMGDYPTFRAVNRELGEWKRNITKCVMKRTDTWWGHLATLPIKFFGDS